MQKKHLIWLLPIILGIVAISFSAFQTVPAPYPSIPDQVKENYLLELKQFQTLTRDLAIQSKSIADSKTNLKKTQETFIACRKAYKKIEFLAEYLDPEFVKKYINGAPLPRLSTDDNKVVEKPEGMQTIEEFLFSDEVIEEKEEIIFLTKKLHENVNLFIPFQEQAPIYHQFIFEAARAQIIRIFSLGITGFDTPVESDGLAESKISLESIEKTIAPYYPLLSKKSTGKREALETTFQQAITYLEQNNDFDTFNRLEFLTDHLNPLFKNLLESHKLLGIPTKRETLPGNVKLSVNYGADNIFSDDLLNPFFYTEQVESQYNEKVVELGKYLFFDPILSENNERSCASCHNPQKAFTDGQKKSIANGFNGTVQRNSPTLINAVYSPRVFHDLRAEKIEKQINHVVFDEKEFNTDFSKIFTRLRQSPDYQQLFKDAYPNMGPKPMHQFTLTAALAAYIVSLRSFSSPFDQYVRGESNTLPDDVKKGFNLFMGKAACGTCHFAPTFAGLVPPSYQEMESEILGVPISKDTLNPEIDPDLGRAAGRIKEGFHIYAHSFKTATLRNVELTAPYMHNGVYETLEEVMDFYNKGGGAGLGLDVPDQTLPPDPLGLNQQEISDIVAFMRSLTNVEKAEEKPDRLPSFPAGSPFNERVIGGVY